MSAEILGRAARGEPLSRAEAAGFLRAFARGEAGPEALASLLTALHIRGETTEVLLGFADVAREEMVPAPVRSEGALDLCGTGGDGQGTVNLSTAAAFVAAGAGARVAKHGNHAVSGRTGSADVLAALGLRVRLSPEEAARCVDEAGLGFLYAPVHHPLFAKVGPVRRALGFRTAFNLLGPLCNPASVRRQVVGAASPEAARLMAEALSRLGVERAWVVHTPGPYDEVSLTAPCEVLSVEKGGVTAGTLTPKDFGAGIISPESLAGGDAAHNAARIEAVLAGETSPLTDAVCANAACALVVAGLAGNPREGFERARAAVASGEARRTLERLRKRVGEAGRVLA